MNTVKRLGATALVSGLTLLGVVEEWSRAELRRRRSRSNEITSTK